ncbi:MAG TPA: BamA/TamA family outer membrane protein [Puia sp.]|nr:BamA/TamA family outer membrane protein [Puia sp.]
MFLKKIFKYQIPLFVFLFCFGMQGYAQKLPSSVDQETNVNPVDLIGVISEMFNKKGPARNDIIIPGVRNLSLLPIVGYGPANGFVIGTAISATNLLGNQKNTQLSSALLSISLTTKKQVLLCARSDIYLPGNSWYIPGDVRLLFFAQPTYGLGIYGLNSTLNFNIDGTDLSNSVLEQPMRFNYIRFYETALKEIFPHWYAGLGINIDDHFEIQDQLLKLDTPNQMITANYFYSTKYGFNPLHYSTNGLLFRVIQDSRDNPINSYKGIYASLGFRVNEKIFGGSQNSTMLYAEWRNYIPLQKNKPGLVLAFWTWGQFVTSGNVPYLALPSIGWDTYGRSGRGYVQGRFRGTNMVYGESEFRMPISRNGLFGAVAFINATTASNPNTGQTLFNSLAPGYGLGLRIKMNMKDRTNICIDYGRGLGSHGIYFNIQETF